MFALPIVFLIICVEILFSKSFLKTVAPNLAIYESLLSKPLEPCGSLLNKIETGLSNCKKKVNQYDKDMKYMNTFNSIKECAKANNISASCVSFNCLGLSKNPKIGYYFRYADE